MVTSMTAAEHAHSSPTPDVAPAAPALSQLLVGYDGSDSANAAAAFGLWLASKAGCRTTLAHVTQSGDSGASAELLPAVADSMVAYKAEWQRRMENMRDYAADAAAVDCHVVSGTPAGALIAAAVEVGADLVMIGSHGGGLARRALLGSVSAQVIAHAPCSVMVFREGDTPAPAAHARTIVVGVDGSPSSRDRRSTARRPWRCRWAPDCCSCMHTTRISRWPS